MPSIWNTSEQERRMKIRNWKRVLGRIVRFVVKQTHKHGKVVSEEIGSCHIHAKRELGVDNFQFLLNEGQTQFGGNTVAINWNGKRVLEVYYQADFNAKTCRVDTLRLNSKWQDPLMFMMNNPILLTSQLKREERERTAMVRVFPMPEDELKAEEKRLGLR